MPSAATAAPTAHEIPPSALGAHWLRLGPESRRRRFNGMVSDEGLRERAANSQAEVILAIDIDDRPRAILEIFPTQAKHAEIAISVEDPYQGLGYGRALLDAGLTHAAELGAETAELHFARGNASIIRLALGAGAEIQWEGNDGMAVIRTSELAPYQK